VRRVLVVAAAVLVALAGSIGLIAFFQSRDDADIGGSGAAEATPGVPAPAETDPRLRKGNVVITYSDQSDGPVLRALAEDVAGPPDMTLADAGQAVIVEQNPDQDEPVVVRAFKRRLVAQSGADREVREFVEYWLGQPAVE
jgi:hypothetical protein